MVLGAKLLTELVGTFLFLTVIALSGGAGPLAPLAIGASLVALVYMGGHVSGAHYNPAVSLAAFLRRKIDLTELLAYWAVQLVAAGLAFSFAFVVSGKSPGIHPGAHAGWLSALAVETVFTAALAVVVLNVAATEQTRGNSFYGLAIGFVIAAAIFTGGPISGGAYNPAVGFGATLGSSLFAGGGWSDSWLYLVGPFLGAGLGAGVHWFQVKGLEPAMAPPEGRPSPGIPAPLLEERQSRP
jgi:aquaporin Z